ncbi:basic helix-loop-helix and HMG box domain-containing protein 1 [Arapaima gigas]
MLPIPNSLQGCILAKQDTLASMQSYLEALQKPIQDLESRLPLDCILRISDTGDCMEQDLALLVERDLCSVWEDLALSDHGSPDSGVLEASGAGMQSLLLGDPMLGPLLLEDEEDNHLGLGSLHRWHSLVSPFHHSSPMECLNLSPSLFTSPCQGLFPEGEEERKGLFKDIWFSPEADPSDPLARSGCSSGSPRREQKKFCSKEQERGGADYAANKQLPVIVVNSNSIVLPSETENKGSDWITSQMGPQKWSSQKRKIKSSSRGRTNSLPPSQPSLRKKCVNGYIMFCRINRKLYHRSHPGTPSTTVTKELASLWHALPEQERQVYCEKARRFNRQQNRNVRMEYEDKDEDKDEEMDEEGDITSLHTLLAHKNLLTTV